MLFVILAIAGVVITLIVACIGADDLSDTTPGFILSAFVGFIIIGFFSSLIVIGLTALAFIPAERHADTSKDSTEILQAIQMGDGVQGQFFLGSGYISEENVYTYYARNPDGSFQSGRISADSAVVIESATETPRIVTHHYYWSRWIMPHSVNDGLDFGGETYTVYVPKGSVKPLVDMSLPK